MNLIKHSRLFATQAVSMAAPKAGPAKSYPITSILFQDQNALLDWASGFAADHIKAEAEKRAGKPLFDQDWLALRKSAASEKRRTYTDERMRVGKVVHEAVNSLISLGVGEKIDLGGYKSNDEVFACVSALQKWLSKCPYEFLKAEFDVRSEKYLYHGRADCIARDNRTNKVCVIDFKIKPKELDFTTAMQLAAYAHAYNESSNQEPDSPDFCSSGIAIQIKYIKGKEAKVVEKSLKDLDAAFKAFICRNVLYRLETANENRGGFSDNWIFSS
jgi:PD-(D/E)XK nuclease superfamily